MKWLYRKDQEPNKDRQILAFCKTCKNMHTVHYDYEEWILAEACYSTGGMFAGEDVDFDYWMELPDPPTLE